MYRYWYPGTRVPGYPVPAVPDFPPPGNKLEIATEERQG
eukprot:SAG11_NODE_5461_length_1553_cov_1.691884_2_plen_38_part_01